MIFTTNLTCTLTSKGNKILVRTARGRLSYPAIFEARESGDDGKLKYSTTLLFPANADLTVLMDACYAVAAKLLGDKWQSKYPKLPMPWHSSLDENQDGVPYWQKIGIAPDEFPTFIRTGSLEKFGKIGVVDHETHPIGPDRAAEVYPGRWALLTVAPYAYEFGSTKKGVSLGLQNVQLLERGEPLAAMRGDAASEFEAVSISDSADIMFKQADVA